MKSLPAPILKEFKSGGKWVISKTQNVYSSIPIDQAHEQLNKTVKGLYFYVIFVAGNLDLTDEEKILYRISWEFEKFSVIEFNIFSCFISVYKKIISQAVLN